MFYQKALKEITFQAEGMEFGNEMVIESAIQDLTIEAVFIRSRVRHCTETLRKFRDGRC